jgi:hypothetical protein
MLRPPSDYQLSKVQLSSHSTKIDNLLFETAIIFFVPKVANKGVDLTTLDCEIVQIIDRGEWGKEEVSFTVDASSFSNRKRREFDLTADAEYSLKIVPPPELRMGILEIYFDPDSLSTNHQDSIMSNTSNPIIVDTSAITNAIAAGSAAQVAATQAAIQAANKNVQRLVESDYAPVAWVSAGKHIAVAVDANRMYTDIFNNGTVPVYFDLFLDVNTKAKTPQMDNIIQPGGQTRIDGVEGNMGVLLYTVGTRTAGSVLINQGYSTAAPVPPSAPPSTVSTSSTPSA